MIDVHAPHETVHTWKDFFIHIATIAVGLLIAVGLEQTVEAIHHHYQRIELREQMRAEAERNLPIERDSISRLKLQIDYLHDLRDVLKTGAVSGDIAAVHGVTPHGGSILHVSPSRSVWSAAQSDGVADIVPAGLAQVYSRRDVNAEWEGDSENAMIDHLQEFVAQCDHAGLRYSDPAPQTLTMAYRGDVLQAIDIEIMKLEEMATRLAIEQGADEAVASGASSLDALYPYQNRAVAYLGFQNSLTNNAFSTASNSPVLIDNIPTVASTAKQ